MTSELGKSRLRFEARTRSAFEASYAEPVSQARRNKPARLIDCLRARKPLSDNDFDLLADFLEDQMRPPGSAAQKDVHEAAALVRTLKRVWRQQNGRSRLPRDEADRLVSYACLSVERFTGKVVDPDKVADLLNRSATRMK